MTTNSPYEDPRYGGYEPHYPPPDPASLPYSGYYAAPQPQPQPQQVQPPAPPHRKRRWALGTGVAALAIAGVVASGTVAAASSSALLGSGSAILQVPTNPGRGVLPGNGDMSPNGRNGGLGGSGTTQGVALATDKQQRGIVTIVSVLKYQNAESAGTGMVLSSDGEVLTNNHVVNGATSITVTVASTGRPYHADVVGTDPSDDVAVLQLQNASGLTTANLGDSSDVKVGDAVVGVGNAAGTGTLRASPGSVTALDRSITATDESGQEGERLTGLIQVDAPIISGDSGGPLYDSAGEVIGMDTAASANRGAAASAYAIPIDNALKIAQQIESKVETSKIHIGRPAFLGVGIGTDTGRGATVETLLNGGPAAAAGILRGSTITAIDGHQVTSGDSLKTVLNGYEPGQRAKVSWIDPTGQPQSATVTLATGPVD